jgi:NADH-quinone oxidoreductase subunit L
MTWIVQNLWLIPTLPVLAAGVIALAKQRHRTLAASAAIGSMFISMLLGFTAFAHVLHLTGQGTEAREFVNIPWFQVGSEWLKIGWVLDPLNAVMLVMVTFVGLLIFIYSVGYMSHDENFTRFFCFLSLFAGAMLGVLIANSLLLFFMCWEVVGLTSYLLIGFWYFKPSAAAAAKKAFITTRIGDLAFLLGIVWLYSESGTLLFYDGGAGALEHTALAAMVSHLTVMGLTVSTCIGLLIFCGAVGKSGQVPLHVWLPDAMEGPTPVSALIHAATMVAAGVFLVARVYPLMSIAQAPAIGSVALTVVTWIGAITAIFAASIAVAQSDIKRILAYSTVSQLGYMMMGLGVGGVAVGMFHLITHAFFKALLFMGAGSVIHGCSGEQDIARMGGLRRFMPITFATYAIGMLALSGFPIFFSGFWSKDAILHSAYNWHLSQAPFILGSIAALLTAFYMTRQIYYVFAGELRLRNPEKEAHPEQDHSHEDPHAHGAHAHESPASMTTPLVILAACTLLLGYFGTPAWPWFQSFLAGESPRFEGWAGFQEPGLLTVMFASTIIALTGLFNVLRNAYFVDAFYQATFIRANTAFAHLCDFFDRWIWNGAVQFVSYLVIGLSWVNRSLDVFVVNPSFDEGCRTVTRGGRLLSYLQNGRTQSYLRVLGLAFAALVLFLLWGKRG